MTSTHVLPNLQFGRATAPVILQSEAAECGLACLAMVLGAHGHLVDLPSLRARHAVSMRGATLADLMHLAAQLDLTARPLRLELEHLGELPLPCVLHWDFNHFVVLTRVQRDRLTVHDPARGRCRLTRAEFSRHFTGVALELTPTPDFQPRRERRPLPLRALVGPLAGLRGTVAQALLLAGVLQFFAVLAPFYMQWVVDQALVSQDRDLVSVLALGFTLLAVLQAGVTALRAWLLMVLGTRVNLQMITRLFRHLLRLPMAWFDKRHLGDVVSRFESLQVIQRTLTTGLLEAVIDGGMAAVTFALMLLYSPTLAAVGLGAALAYAGLRLTLYRPLREGTEEHIVRGARQRSHFLESVRGMQTLKLYGQEAPRTAAWQNLCVDEFNAGIRTQRLGILYQSLNGLIFGVENTLCIWLGAQRVLDASPGAGFSVGMLFAFIAYKTQFVQRVAALVDKGLELRMLGLHLERVADIATTPAERLPAVPASASTGPAGRRRGAGEIALESLSFRYGDNEPWILQDLNLRIAPGESVAIVGPSGGGKSTLVKLLLGLQTPTQGRIAVDGHSLAGSTLARWRAQVGSVMQDDPLFAGSIAQNIAFFDPHPDAPQIEACARLASIHEDIVRLPMQYDTPVGDMGAALSGGQKQRLLLARALYRCPAVLILDEATSHLDLDRERSVNEAIRGLPLTRILVAHRPETIASADRVIELQGGRIVHDGPPRGAAARPPAAVALRA